MLSKFVVFVWVLAYGHSGGVATTAIEFDNVESCRAAAEAINKQRLAEESVNRRGGPHALCIRRRAD